VDVEAKLKSKEWSKDNVTVLQPKKSVGNDDNIAGGKKIKQKKQDVIILKIETLIGSE
jgi:hypothetical protein